jgi:hypothetical protein
MAYSITLVPAFHRDYKSQKEAKDAFLANKDFKVADLSHPDDGRYCNMSDLLRTNTTQYVNIRYKKLTMVCVIDLAKLAKQVKE